jgi:hypothetical protein
MTDTKAEGMDAEWVALILEAKKMGLSKECVREFLFQNKVKEILVKNN